MRKLFLIGSLLLMNFVYGQSSDWSVNESSFQYTMTITAVLNVNGAVLTNTNDKVGAFVGSQARGEANVVYNAKANKYLVYLTVYSNTEGESINFKIYNSGTKKVITTSQTIKFKIDGDVGGVFQSFSISDPALSKVAEISSFSLKGISETATINDETITIEVPTNTVVTNLVPVFNTANNGKLYINNVLQTSGSSTVDFTNPVIYEVFSEDESVKKQYTVTVTKKIESNPPSVVLSTTKLLSNVQPAIITLEASEAILGLTNDDFTVENAIVSKVTKQTNSTFTLELVALSEGNFSIQLSNDKVTNTNNQGNIQSNKLTLTLDSKKPFIERIRRKVHSKEFTKGTSVVFEVTFSEDVTNVNKTNFSSVSKSSIAVTKINDLQYEVAVNDLTNFSGAVSLRLSENVSIQDKAGNTLQTSNITSYEK